LEEVPLAVGDPRVMYRTAVNGSLLDAFATMQNRTTGRRVVGILGAAQIDPYGNLNSTVIGDYDAPRVRFSGSGGAADVASFVSRTIIFMQHEKRKFVPEVDYLTSPGWLSGGDARRQAGLSEGGPHLVITNMAIMGFDAADHRMFLKAIYPGVHVSDIIQNTGFDIDVSRVESTPPPSEKELRILRHICDPQKLILG
jgi:glutaconate CoA-transferase subunit B